VLKLNYRNVVVCRLRLSYDLSGLLELAAESLCQHCRAAWNKLQCSAYASEVLRAPAADLMAKSAYRVKQAREVLELTCVMRLLQRLAVYISH
jgi:hypothetical protein